MSNIETLRTRLIEYINDSIDQLIDDDYDDANDDIARIDRMIDHANIVHVLFMYERNSM